MVATLTHGTAPTHRTAAEAGRLPHVRVSAPPHLRSRRGLSASHQYARTG